MHIIGLMFTIPVVIELYFFIFPTFSSIYDSDYVLIIYVFNSCVVKIVCIMQKTHDDLIHPLTIAYTNVRRTYICRSQSMKTAYVDIG